MSRGAVAVLAAVAMAAALSAPVAATRQGLLHRMGRCPPKGFDALKDFSIQEYISAPWFVQQQAPLVYQPKDQLFCVAAVYEPLNSTNILAGLRVKNYANEGAVNGPTTGTFSDDGPRLIATVPDAQRPAKLRVGFARPGSGNRQVAAGPYWVVAAGQSADPAHRSSSMYDWAIVVGGEPRRPTQNGCATGSRNPAVRRYQTNGVGLWLFSRFPTDPANTQVMLAKLGELGLDGSDLVLVQQQGCTYQGSGISRG